MRLGCPGQEIVGEEVSDDIEVESMGRMHFLVSMVGFRACFCMCMYWSRCSLMGITLH